MYVMPWSYLTTEPKPVWFWRDCLRDGAMNQGTQGTLDTPPRLRGASRQMHPLDGCSRGLGSENLSP